MITSIIALRAGNGERGTGNSKKKYLLNTNNLILIRVILLFPVPCSLFPLKMLNLVTLSGEKPT